MDMTSHRPITGKLVIATHNAGKLREMRELLALYGIEAVSSPSGVIHLSLTRRGTGDS